MLDNNLFSILGFNKTLLRSTMKESLHDFPLYGVTTLGLQKMVYLRYTKIGI